MDVTILSPTEIQPNKTDVPLLSRHPEISKSQMEEFRDEFRLFDKDEDGSVTAAELGQVMRSLGQFSRKHELPEILKEIDTYGDRKFSSEEFVNIAWTAGAGANRDPVQCKEQEEQEMRDIFRIFDKHNRGFITASDVYAIMKNLGKDIMDDESKVKMILVVSIQIW